VIAGVGKLARRTAGGADNGVGTYKLKRAQSCRAAAAAGVADAAVKRTLCGKCTVAKRLIGSRCRLG